jgi:hypothetical protein
MGYHLGRQTMKITAVTMSMIEGKAHAFVCRYNEGDCFDFRLLDNTIQGLVDTLNKVYPDWHDASQSIAKRELV